ncbi:MAG: hypothetical protein IJ068_00330 [Bacilli bacterium]|nr:hypothetical protein [Bacilli bacterium]
MLIDFLDNYYVTKNKELFQKTSGIKDYDSKVKKIAKKLSDTNTDEVTLTFLFTDKMPDYIFIEKKVSSSPTLEYYQNQINSDLIEDANIVCDSESYHIIDICRISNRKYIYETREQKFRENIPSILKLLGNNKKQIEKRLKEIDKGFYYRNQIINELKDKYSLSKYKEELFSKTYVINNNDDKIFVKVDFSHIIKIYKNDDLDYVSFEPVGENSVKEVIEYVDNLIKNIKI